jgi:hypothetical protein
MSAQEDTLAEFAASLTELRIPYMVIGGLANAVWGVPRATLDINVTIWVAEPAIADTIRRLSELATCLVDEPLAFVQRTRVLPLESRHGIRIDVIFGSLPFEEHAIRRARVISVAGTEVLFCTPDDLILQKIISTREQDLADARGVTLRRWTELELAYLEPRIDELATLLERPEIARAWRDWKREASQQDAT